MTGTEEMPVPRLGDMSRPSSVRRFWRYVDTTGVCWEWAGPVGRKGYGATHMRDTDGALITTGAHRRAYRALVGEIPDGMTLDHLCRVKTCVNPDHLEVVTRDENYDRALFETESCRNGHPYTSDNTLATKSAPHKNTKRCRQCILVRMHRAKGADCSYDSFCDAVSHLAPTKTVKAPVPSTRQFGGDRFCTSAKCSCHKWETP